MTGSSNKANSDENIFRILLARFLPYWPLFAVLLPIGLIGTWVYLKTVTPIYEATATLIIKDENKGVDDSKVLEAMNPFDSKKIVENEIEVIQSRALMKQVILDLQLYTTLFEDKLIGSKPAYNTSPIIVELKEPEKIFQHTGKNPIKFYFTYDSINKTVEIDNRKYPIDQWVLGLSSYGEIKFKQNINRSDFTENKLYYTFTHPKAMTRNLLKGLDVSAINKLSTVVRLTFEDPIPNRGEDILNQLILAYNQKAVSDRNNLASNTLTFIEERMEKVETELYVLEKSIQKFKSTEGAVDLSAQGRLYLQDVGEYDRQIAADSRQLSVLKKVEEYVVSKDNQGGLVPSTIGTSDPILNSLLNKLYDSEVKYARLKKTTAENNPILASIANEISKIRPSILENIQNQKSNLRASLGSLSYNAGKSSSALSNIPEKERALLEIERGKAIKNELFSFLQQKREETALSYAPNGGDGRIVDLAEANYSPISPKPMIAYLIAFVLAFGIGLGYIVFREMVNKNILFRSEIEDYTTLPVAIELPHIPSLIDENSKISIEATIKNWLKKLISKSNLLSRITGMNNNEHIEIKPGEGLLLNHFRQLGAQLGLYDRNFKKKKILVTSSIAGEGKSFVSANLAYSFAQSGKKVVLVDMDFIKPQTTRMFELSKAMGISDFLNGKANANEIIKKSGTNKNLFIVPTGAKLEDHTNLLLNGQLDLLFEKLSENFDYVIIDSAPVNLVADINLLSQYIDKTLFVIRHAKTPIQLVKHFDDSSMLKSLKNVSIIFNDIKKRGLAHDDMGYGYGYSPGLNYGYYQKNNP